jgi:uncharacterized Zn-binding protein involved in type VI secretion
MADLWDKHGEYRRTSPRLRIVLAALRAAPAAEPETISRCVKHQHTYCPECQANGAWTFAAINGPAACSTLKPASSQEDVVSAGSGAAPIEGLTAAIAGIGRISTLALSVEEWGYVITAFTAALAYQKAAAEVNRLRASAVAVETAVREHIAGLAVELARVKGERDALVMAVARKYPGETRYETALRYINEREQADPLAASAPAKDAK